MLGLRGGVGVGGTADCGAAEPPRVEGVEGVVEADGQQSARVWEEEAEERQMRQREGDVSLRRRRARVTAEGARALADVRRAVVRREGEGLRLAEELSEDRLLVALETLELAAAGQAERQHTLERKTRLAQDERLELKVLRRNVACLESLRRFEATAEAVDERGRRRLWVEYRRGGAASEGRGRHHVIGGYRSEGGGDGEQGKWRSTSLQGCPREVRLLLAGLYYYDVDMVNSLPNVARQLAKRGMVSESCLRALCELCGERDKVLMDIVVFYGLVGSPALGETARDVAKDLPIRLLHGGGHAAWLEAHGLTEGHTVFPLMAQLERELRTCRRQVYLYMKQHDPVWLGTVEAHVRKEKAPNPRARVGGGVQSAAATTAEKEARMQERVEASVFARVLQDVEDRCLGCVRRVLQGEGWPARSWQQDGLLVEDMDGRQLRGGGGGGAPAVARLEAAMRRAEEAVLEQEGMEIGLLIKDFFEGPVEPVLQRMAGPGGRRPGVGEARGAARQARAAGGGRAPPPPRTLPAEARAATAEAQAARAERTEAALAAEVEGLARERRGTMLRRRQGRLDDALVAAADEPAVHEAEAGGAGAADAGPTGARKRRRGEGEGEGEDGSEEGDDDVVAADLTTGGDESVRAMCDFV